MLGKKDIKTGRWGGCWWVLVGSWQLMIGRPSFCLSEFLQGLGKTLRVLDVRMAWHM